MNNYEMNGLKAIENDDEMHRIFRQIEKVYNLLNFGDNNAGIDYSNIVSYFSLEEEIFLEKVGERLDFNVSDYTETSTVFIYQDSVFKIIFAYDKDFSYAYREFQTFNAFDSKITNTHFFVVGKKTVEDRQTSVEFFSSLILELFNIYMTSKGIDIVGSPVNDYQGTGLSLRRAIDYFIVIFRILDGALDLKFVDWDYIRNNLLGAIDIDKLKYAYEYAITTDHEGANEKDYEEMIRKSIEEFEYPKSNPVEVIPPEFMALMNDVDAKDIIDTVEEFKKFEEDTDEEINDENN